ncbi:MAG: 16S rRNA (guanine(527)-N(7))-methyltransferase RsmG [Nitrospiraceae bacterium]|nr:MAG: 16S rRNA (guanine(527)-N(7))-methyltransferase RsmG [Nitrospiraceae bacterium]
MIYLSELKKWNRTYNITALRTDEDIIIKHFLDSLLYLRALPEGKIKLADIGTGGGFPGIPLKIIRPDMELALVEPARKKASFLRHIVRMIDLTEVSVLQNKIEHMEETFHNYFDLIVTRATFNIEEFLDMSCPFLNDSGRLVISKGPKAEDELKQFTSTDSSSSPVEKSLVLKLPFSDAQRHIIILKC